ncbi:MAG TPA: pitrilysin family protein, partial [Longimicrobium sp.]|nr:pitrilysin family protein [Longimicrobium sp.]
MSAPDRTRAPEPGALRPFHFPPVHRHTLANGMRVVAAEMRDFPVVTVSLVADAGGLADAPDKAGSSALVSALLESGAAGKSADEIAELVDGLGVSLDAGISWDTVQVGFTSLTSRMEEAMGVLADVALRPEFPRDEVDRLRDERLALLRQRRGTPSNLADEVEIRYVYAPGVPYARPLGGYAETVSRLTRDDLTVFHDAWYRPASAAIVAAGDASIDELVALAERHFGGWSGAPPHTPTAEVRPRLDRATIVIADRPGSVQSELRVSHVGIARADP